MSFLFPIALLGLLSLAVPLILHFIKKAEVQEMDWAAMEFLQVKEARSMRRKSLKNLFAAPEPSRGVGLYGHCLGSTYW